MIEAVTPTHQYIFYVTGEDFRRKESLPYSAENFCLAHTPEIPKVNMSKWQTMSDEERYRILCTCFELVLASNQSLSRRLSDLEKAMNDKCVWKDED